MGDIWGMLGGSLAEELGFLGGYAEGGGANGGLFGACWGELNPCLLRSKVVPRGILIRQENHKAS